MITRASAVILAGGASRRMGRDKATIRSGERCAFAFYDQIRVRYVAPADIDHPDPELRSFRNLNAPQDWRTALVEARPAGKNGGLPPA
jgi:molybdopterin-guanine dinucleotide biosynthesis protein A